MSSIMDNQKLSKAQLLRIPFPDETNRAHLRGARRASNRVEHDGLIENMRYGIWKEHERTEETKS